MGPTSKPEDSHFMRKISVLSDTGSVGCEVKDQSEKGLAQKWNRLEKDKL
jgi:hypothetical protein